MLLELGLKEPVLREMAAALEALRDEMRPCMGILTLKSHASETRRLMPSPSDPMMSAIAPVRSVDHRPFWPSAAVR